MRCPASIDAGLAALSVQLALERTAVVAQWIFYHSLLVAGKGGCETMSWRRATSKLSKAQPSSLIEVDQEWA